MKSLTGYRFTSRNRKNRRWAAVFLLPDLAGVILLVFLPFFDVVRRSFSRTLTGEYAGLENYRAVLENRAFYLAAGNTLKFVAVCIPALMLLSLFLAYGLSLSGYRELCKSLYLLPLAVPAATVVLSWRLLFDKQGLINALLVRFSAKPHDFMGTTLSFWVLVISYIWKNLGYTVVLWLAGIMGIPEGMTEAAKVDGAGTWVCFFRIILPNLKPTFYTIAVLSVLNSFKVFREAYLVAGPYPNEGMYLLQHLFNNWFMNLDMDKMASAAALLAAVLTVFVVLLQRVWDKKEEWV